MTTPPPNTKINDMYYIGFYSEGKLIAVMDLIDGYPEQKIAYIGFFVTNVTIQKRGVGSETTSNVSDTVMLAERCL